MAEKDRNEQSVKTQTGGSKTDAQTQSGAQSGEPGRTPGAAEGDRQTVEQDLRNKQEQGKI
jgi:hypothetical protein